MDKSIIIKQFTDNGYETLFPKTIADQIERLGEKLTSLHLSKIKFGSYTGTGNYDAVLQAYIGFRPQVFWIYNINNSGTSVYSGNSIYNVSYSYNHQGFAYVGDGNSGEWIVSPALGRHEGDVTCQYQYSNDTFFWKYYYPHPPLPSNKQPYAVEAISNALQLTYYWIALG